MTIENGSNHWMDGIDFSDPIYNMENETNRTADDAIYKSVSLKPAEEQLLSQTISQLNMNSNNDDANNNKKKKKNVPIDLEAIPDYLTKHNHSFRQALSQALSTITSITPNKNNCDQMESLRHIAILTYKIMFIQLHHYLWTMYLKSGAGQLISLSQSNRSYSLTISMWSKQLKTLLQLPTEEKIKNEHEFYSNLLRNHLYEFEQRSKQYRIELHSKITHLHGYTVTIQKMIEVYIEENLQPYRTEIAHQVELIRYDYHIRALKLEYLRHVPNDYQENVMKQICQARYEQETVEQKYQLLEKQIAHYSLPMQSFDASSLAHSPLVDSINNVAIRQVISKQFKEIAEQSRTLLFEFYLKTAADQRDEYKRKYELQREQMQSNQQSDDSLRKLSPSMIQLIDDRCEKIGERIQCIYRYKTAAISTQWQSDE